MNKLTTSFFNAYIELDKACMARLEVSRGGVTTYINRLAELRFAPERSEVLPKLIKYRKMRNIIAHEGDSLTEPLNISKLDVKWLNRFTRILGRRADPISRYERKSRLYSFWRKVKVFLIAGLGLAILAALVIILRETAIV